MIKRISLLFLALVFKQSISEAQEEHPLVTSGKVLVHHYAGSYPETRVAACAPATAIRDLEWNNISARIETGGSMWNNRAVGLAHYYAPKDGNLSVMYAGALWMGGLSPDQQLKLAAITYRFNGNDFWPGPLSNDGTAEISEVECERWDKFHVSYRADAQRHRQYFECANDPNCDLSDQFPNGYSVPSYFFEYPAIGNTAAGQDLYLAPFYDFDGDGAYNPENGDYPWYDFLREINCAERQREDPVPLFGDQTYYWIFNDKGNIHTESGGQPIGMEVRAQAFAFNTNDEINNMTFYNYVLINQGTQTLTETYFGTWIDCDIGGHTDDFVGCDVQRGLGYGYNGSAFDPATGLSPGYGEYPPAVGVDFFEGPYQDADGIDNPLTTDLIEAIDMAGIPYKGIGIGYGDSIVDNERFGMRKFLYHITSSAANGTPEIPVHFYNYLRGFWRNGVRMGYGGNALTSSTGANMNIAADYMFPGDSDPLQWGTLGVDVEPWSEVSAENFPGDRRFMQSAGPFTLEPGDYNNITVGVVYARSFEGDPFESVNLLLSADDKAQALFDNCFELISGPDAPDVEVLEMDKEIILYLTNEQSISSNFQETYALADPTIPEIGLDGEPLSEEERSYLFQGYLIYQLASEDVSPADLNDVEKARLISQSDLNDDISTIINYSRDEETAEIVPDLMVSGNNHGLEHSIRITTDAFATGDNRLVNHKTYYFMAIAYAHNEYAPYDIAQGSGQDEPFIASRKSAFGAIPVIKAIPHIISPQGGGSMAHSSYGTEIPLTRHEGRGNGQNYLDLAAGVESEILASGEINSVSYTGGGSPVKVVVIDPLRVPAADFDLRLAVEDQDLEEDEATWVLNNLTSGESFFSNRSIQILSEEIVLQWGLAIHWHQYHYEDPEQKHFTDLVGAQVIFDNTSEPWLTGIPDDDSNTPLNWIRSGSSILSDPDLTEFQKLWDDYQDGDVNSATGVSFPTDAEEEFEDVVGGTWSPFCLGNASVFIDDQSLWYNNAAPASETFRGDMSPVQKKFIANIAGLNNVDVVITSDKSKWTRCPVLEMQCNPVLSEGNASKMQLRRSPSTDKNGRKSGTVGCNENEATMNGTQPQGMGWFPGFAIDLSTGERLNMAFGEDSWLVGENGRDMIWNPTSRIFTDIGGDFLFGGQHWIYVFKNLRHEMGGDDGFIPSYDQGNYVYGLLDDELEFTTAEGKKFFAGCTWTGSSLLAENAALLSPENGLIPGDLRIELRVAKPYRKHSATVPDDNNMDYTGAENYWNPWYTFTTEGLEPVMNSAGILEESLSLINVVPNPYYAYSSYESNKLDNRVKITNLPNVCTIRIYDLNGTLIRSYEKADPITSLDWDLKNGKNIPISSGTYIIHVEVPGIGEKILKWFGVMRPIDLDNF